MTPQMWEELRARVIRWREMFDRLAIQEIQDGRPEVGEILASSAYGMRCAIQLMNGLEYDATEKTKGSSE